MYCIACGTKLPDVAWFCPRCGTPVTQPNDVGTEPAPLAADRAAPRSTTEVAAGRPKTEARPLSGVATGPTDVAPSNGGAETRGSTAAIAAPAGPPPGATKPADMGSRGGTGAGAAGLLAGNSPPRPAPTPVGTSATPGAGSQAAGRVDTSDAATSGQAGAAGAGASRSGTTGQNRVDASTPQPPVKPEPPAAQKGNGTAIIAAAVAAPIVWIGLSVIWVVAWSFVSMPRGVPMPTFPLILQIVLTIGAVGWVYRTAKEMF